METVETRTMLFVLNLEFLDLFSKKIDIPKQILEQISTSIIQWVHFACVLV